MRIAYENYIDTASTLTALSADVGYPIENVQEQRLSMEYRTTDASAQTITIDLGAAMTISVAAILSHNFTSSATIVVAANDSDSWGSPATSQTIVFNAGIALKFFVSTSYRYWQFQITDPTNPDGYLSMGRLWLGSYITIDPSSLLNFSVIKTRSDNVIHGRNRQKYASIGAVWRAFNLSFPPSDTTMVNKLLTWFDFSGNHSSFIFCNFDDIRDCTIVEPCYCSLNGDLSFDHEKLMKFSYKLDMEEER